MAFVSRLLIFCLLAMSAVSALQLELGDDAPDFFLKDQEGYLHSLYQHRGQYVLLFFYPRDFIPFSVKEVLAFEHAYQDLKRKNVVIYGISNDDEKRHLKFHEKFHLTYDLLSDPEEKIIKSYEAKGLLGRKFVSYLVGPDGRIFRKYSGVSPIKHPHLALGDIP